MDSAGSRASGPGEGSLVFVEFIAIINFDELHMVWRLRWVCEAQLRLLGRGVGGPEGVLVGVVGVRIRLC